MNRAEAFSNKNDLLLNEVIFEKLFSGLYSALCRHSIRFVRIPEIAEEIVQDQFIYLWEKRDELHIHTSIKSYLFTAVKNKSIDYLRSKFAKQKFVQEEYSHNLPELSNPQKLLEEKEAISLVTNAMNELPEKCYTIFSLSRFGGLSNKEIAKELSISEKTVENQITIAIKKIKIGVGKYLVCFLPFLILNSLYFLSILGVNSNFFAI